jgi:micrococcal nuclease
MKFSKLLMFLVIAIIISSLFPSQSFAHNGKRDELGGHFRSADCMYLLHSPTELAKTAKNISELVSLIKKHNSNTKCNVSESTIDLEGYQFPSESNETETKSESNTTSTQPKEKTKPSPTLQMGKKYTATLDKCVDGDTANFIVEGQLYKTRFLYIDTPESTIEKEPFGKEASEYTCSFLKQGNIQLEPDGKDLFDKYDRLLAWVWVGEKLHQEEITKAGFVEDFYDYGDYKYEDRIVAAMNYATTNYTGMYTSNKPAETTETKSTENDTTNSSSETTTETEESEPVSTSKDEETTVQGKSTDNKTKEESTPKQEEEQVNTTQETLAETTETEESSTGLAIFAFISVIIFFFIPSIKSNMGIKPLIAHKLKSKRKGINILLGLLYLGLSFFIFIIVAIELIHLIAVKKKKESVA